ARQLAGEPNLIRAARAIAAMGPKTVVVKRGEYGALMLCDGLFFMAPAFPLDSVYDPTGAGDTFAGGFVGYLASTDRVDPATLRVPRGLASAVVSFSGGVDSTFLARAAREALGDRALLVTADSETYPASELAAARELARSLGMRHVVVATRELDNPDYVRNPANRCFFCKEELFTTLAPIAAREGV